WHERRRGAADGPISPAPSGNGALVHRPQFRGKDHAWTPPGRSAPGRRSPGRAAGWGRGPAAPSPGPRLLTPGPGRERAPARLCGRTPGEERRHHPGMRHLSVPRGPGSSPATSRTVPRDLRQRLPGSSRGPGREGPLPQGPRRAHPGVHR
ncbi:hypothetical protein OY671_012467, partial [Metschnikowia pulcherrima]